MSDVPERPILFRGDMVRAIFAGAKDNTRRLRGLAAINATPDAWRHLGTSVSGPFPFESDAGVRLDVQCPYGRIPGGRLWVRENVYIAPPGFDDGVNANATDAEGHRRTVGYAADMNGDAVRCARDYGVKQTPCILMPRWACRLRLEVVSIRPERIQSITEEDARREGIVCVLHPTDVRCGCLFARQRFGELWSEMHGDSWDRNEWSWRVEFRRAA